MFYSHCFAEAGESHSSVVCEKKKKKRKGHFGVTQRELGLFLPELDMYFMPETQPCCQILDFIKHKSASEKLILRVKFYQSDVRLNSFACSTPYLVLTLLTISCARSFRQEACKKGLLSW